VDKVYLARTDDGQIEIIKIRRNGYNWSLDRIEHTLKRLEVRVKDNGITYEEYQDCIILLNERGLL